MQCHAHCSKFTWPFPHLHSNNQNPDFQLWLTSNYKKVDYRLNQSMKCKLRFGWLGRWIEPVGFGCLLGDWAVVLVWRNCTYKPVMKKSYPCLKWSCGDTVTWGLSSYSTLCMWRERTLTDLYCFRWCRRKIQWCPWWNGHTQWWNVLGGRSHFVHWTAIIADLFDCINKATYQKLPEVSYFFPSWIFFACIKIIGLDINCTIWPFLHWCLHFCCSYN